MMDIVNKQNWLSAPSAALTDALRAAGPPLLFGLRLWASVCLATEPLEILASAFRVNAVGLIGSLFAFLAVSWITGRYCRDIRRIPRPVRSRNR